MLFLSQAPCTDKAGDAVRRSAAASVKLPQSISTCGCDPFANY